MVIVEVVAVIVEVIALIVEVVALIVVIMVVEVEATILWAPSSIGCFVVSAAKGILLLAVPSVPSISENLDS